MLLRRVGRIAPTRLLGPARHCSSAVPSVEYASTCVIPTEWRSLPLIARREVSHDASVYDFGLPDDTPISDNSTRGKFELLVRRYQGGAASEWLHGLPLGATVDFKHIKFNVKEPYPFEGKKTITMIAGGSGITPMYQALWKVLLTPGDERKVVLLYGNKSTDDILLKHDLEVWARAYPERLKVVHVVGKGPNDPPPEGWRTSEGFVAETGWIDRAKIEKYAFPPAADTLMFVCGVPAMYDSLCGPRTEKAVAEGSVLQQLGYDGTMVAKM